MQATHECYIHDETNSSHKYKQSKLTPFQLEGTLLKPEVAGILADLGHFTGGKGIPSGQTKARGSVHVLRCRQEVSHCFDLACQHKAHLPHQACHMWQHGELRCSCARPEHHGTEPDNRSAALYVQSLK